MSGAARTGAARRGAEQQTRGLSISKRKWGAGAI
jgi:hypothetical protein